VNAESESFLCAGLVKNQYKLLCVKAEPEMPYAGLEWWSYVQVQP